MAKQMCELAKKLPKNLEKYISKINNPVYICKKCGRVSNDEKSLCKPIEL